ncbi:prepilin peptidase [Aeromicrobium sp.]|uniref:prepilin peptidase n=1 Tax=Aeromicrobium sp. TaxID=1871063 RepID=UPI003D6A2DE8
MIIAIAAALAALVGAAGPLVLARLPEPPEPDDDKLAYVTLAGVPYLSLWFAGAAAAMAGLAAWKVPTELVPVWVLFAGVGTWLAYVDWRTRLLPFLLVAPMYVATLALVALGAFLLDDWSVLAKGLIGNVAVFAVFWLIYQLGQLFDGGAFGYGDVRLSGVVGLALGALGAAETLTGTYGGFVLGAVGGLAFSRLGWVDSKGFAFGPYLVVGAIIGAAWGASLWPM